jgi:hypothetical protein
MWFKHPAWVPVAWILCLVNLAAVGVYAQTPMHAAGHGVLAALFGLWAQHLRSRTTPAADADVIERVQELEARLADLEALPDVSVSGRLSQLEARLDFAERVLADVRKRGPSPPAE